MIFAQHPLYMYFSLYLSGSPVVDLLHQNIDQNHLFVHTYFTLLSQHPAPLQTKPAPHSTPLSFSLFLIFTLSPLLFTLCFTRPRSFS